MLVVDRIFAAQVGVGRMCVALCGMFWQLVMCVVLLKCVCCGSRLFYRRMCVTTTVMEL